MEGDAHGRGWDWMSLGCFPTQTIPVCQDSRCCSLHPHNEDGIGGDEDGHQVLSGAAATLGCQSVASACPQQAGNTGVQSALASLSLTPASSSLVTAPHPLSLSHFSPGRSARRRKAFAPFQTPSPSTAPASLFLYFCAHFHAARGVFPASLALGMPTAPHMCRMSNVQLRGSASRTLGWLDMAGGPEGRHRRGLILGFGGRA